MNKNITSLRSLSIHLCGNSTVYYTVQLVQCIVITLSQVDRINLQRWSQELIDVWQESYVAAAFELILCLVSVLKTLPLISEASMASMMLHLLFYFYKYWNVQIRSGLPSFLCASLFSWKCIQNEWIKAELFGTDQCFGLVWSDIQSHVSNSMD